MSRNRTEKPYSPACEANKRPILRVLKPLLEHARTVLEIGSGTGQHAVFFAAALPHLIWQTSDLSRHHLGIRLWLDEAGLPNVLPPLILDVTGRWPDEGYDAVFSANTAHILAWPAVEALFRGVANTLAPGGLFMLYGPFNEGGRYTSESNARFDASLRAQNPESGLRDIDDLCVLAEHGAMQLVQNQPMPTNNRTLIWRRAE